MSIKTLLISSVAALALVACGNNADGDSATPSNNRAGNITATSPIDTAFQLKGASELDLDKFMTLFPENVRPTYETAAFDADKGATILTNIRFTSIGGDIDTTNDENVEHSVDIEGDIEIDGFVIERAELYGVDQASIDRLLASEETAIDAPMETVFEKVRLFGLAGLDGDNQPKDDVTVGAIEIDKLKLRQGGLNDESEANKFAKLMNAFTFGGLYFKDVAIDANAEEQGASFTLAAPDIRLIGAGGGKLDSIIANNMEYTVSQSPEALATLTQALPQAGLFLNGPLRNLIAPESQRTTMGSMNWQDIDISGLMAFGLKNEEPPFTARDLIDLGSITIKDVDQYIGEKRLATAPETIVSDMEFTWLAPSKIRSVAKGVQYDFTAYLPDQPAGAEASDVDPDIAAAAEILKKYKLDNVKGDSLLTYDWDAEKGDADLVTTFTAPNLANFNMAFALEGLSLDAIEKSDGASPVAEIGKLSAIEVVLDDTALLDAVFELAAIQGGAPRSTMPTTMRFLGLQAASINPRISGYIDAAAGFIEKGGKLTIKAAPEEPVAFKTLSDPSTAPQTLPDVLNLTVEHDK